MATGSLDTAPGAFAHILAASRSFSIGMVAATSVTACCRSGINSGWFLVLNKSSDKVVKKVETQNVWWPVVPQWRLTGDDPSTKLFDEKVDVEVSCVRCCSVLHEPVILAPGLVLDLWPDMLLQHLLIPL